jgi:hypothetical protein
MDKTERLIHLVLRLDKKQKKAIEQGLKGKNQALALFDIICKHCDAQNRAGEDILLSESAIEFQMQRKNIPPKQLRHPRLELASVILEVLRNNMKDQSKIQEIDTKFKEGLVLRQYGQYDWAIEVFEAALKEAEKYQIWDYTIKISLEMVMLKLKQNAPFLEEIWPITLNVKKRIEHQYYEQQYECLLKQLMLYQQGARGKKLLELLAIGTELSQTEILNEFKGESMLAHSTFLICREYTHPANGLENFNRMEQEVLLWLDDQNTHFREEYRQKFASRLKRIISEAVKLGKFEIAEQYLSALKNVEHRSEEEEAEFFALTKGVEQFILLNQKKFKVVAEMTPVLMKELKRFVLKISAREQIIFIINQASAHFFLMEFKQTALLCDNILKIRTDQRSDLLMVAQWLRSISKAEGDDYNAREKLVKSYENIQVTVDLKEEDLSRVVVYFVGKYIADEHRYKGVPDRSTREAQHGTLIAFNQWLTHHAHRRASTYGYTEVWCWVRSRLNKTTMQQELEQIDK